MATPKRQGGWGNRVRQMGYTSPPVAIPLTRKERERLLAMGGKSAPAPYVQAIVGRPRGVVVRISVRKPLCISGVGHDKRLICAVYQQDGLVKGICRCGHLRVCHERLGGFKA